MIKNRLFGTDGVRGVVNEELTPELAYNLGKSAAHILKRDSEKTTFIIGKDTRLSGDLLSMSLAAGLLASGANVIDADVIPTPAIAYLVRKYKATAGVMISASHNPFEYNGIKFFDNKGFKLSDKVEDNIQELIESNFSNIPNVSHDSIGTYTKNINLEKDYLNFLSNTVTTKLNNLNIALDCGNGATYKIAESLFKNLGANVKVISTLPNGININDKCGSTYMDSLKEIVLKEHFDMGFAFDGDGDRCLAVDGRGCVVDGDRILSIFGIYLNKVNNLSKNTIVGTAMSNLGFINAMKRRNIDVIQTNVGDRYVLEEMIKNNYNLGGESSGHIIFTDYNTTGDGLLTAIQLASICSKENKSIQELGSIMIDYPQTLVNIHVPNSIKHSLLTNVTIQDCIAKEQSKLKEDGRILVRASGTEPLIRVMVEGSDETMINEIAENISNTIKNTAI